MSEYNYLGNWDYHGVPNYLENTDDIISPELIARINTSLPSKGDVSVHSPHYLANTHTRNVIIKSSDPGFSGADIWVTFITEGAGYRNVLGYYWYDLHDDLIVPSKLVDSVYVPMTYDDKDQLDENGKSILHKTCIFPNTSLKRSGGKLKPGNKVKILYDPENPSTKFPNNVGVGFFLIPDGWNYGSNNFTNKPNIVYSDREFNSHNPDVDGNIQVILFQDLENSNLDQSEFILGFEDIMRPGGDSDYNDLVVKITIDPEDVYDTAGILTLTPSDPFETNKLVSDCTGLYINLTNSMVTTLMNTSNESFYIKHTIRKTSNDELEILKTVLDTTIMENLSTIAYSPDYLDLNSDPLALVLTYIVPKNMISTYMYLLKSTINAEIDSTFDESINNLVWYQDNYIFAEDIDLDSISILDENDTSTLLTITGRPDTTRMTGPLCMGDPHITTIFGQQYTLDNNLKFINLYNDKELVINSQLEKYPQNKGTKYENMSFMQYLYVNYNGNDFIVDMFTPGKIYDVNMNIIDDLPSTFEFIDYEKIASYDKYNKLPIDKIKIICIKTFTKNLGEIILKITYILQNKDYINDFKILSKNPLIMNGKGAMINASNKNNIEMLTVC